MCQINSDKIQDTVVSCVIDPLDISMCHLPKADSSNNSDRLTSTTLTLPLPSPWQAALYGGTPGMTTREFSVDDAITSYI